MSSRRIIVTGAFGEHVKLAELTVPTIKAYADQCRADFHCLSGKDAEGWPTPHWAKLGIRDMLKQEGGWYDEAAWIDCDAVVRPGAPSLFDIAGGLFCAYPESERLSRIRNFEEFCRIIRNRIMSAARYFNTGVMVIPSGDANALLPPVKESLDAAARLRREQPDKFFNDQDWINSNVAVLGITATPLPLEFNFMPFDDVWGQRIQRAHVIHYAGLYSRLGDGLLGLIAADLKAWGSGHA
jgi:hypothetical protein